jgi:pilus assembly protein Flp/PilA
MRGPGSFWRGEEGSTAIEYGLIASLIAVVIVGAVTLVGTAMSQTYSDIAAAMP